MHKSIWMTNKGGDRLRFCEKLDYLLSVSGINNSKLAKKLHVDASLIGKWRRGQRHPSSQALIEEIGRALVACFQSDYMRRDLSMMTGIPAIQLDNENVIQDTIITWLSTPYEQNSANELLSVGHTQGNYHSRLLNEHLAVNHKGRILVLKRLAALLEKEKRLSCLRIFSDEPCEWLKIFSEHLDVLETNGFRTYGKFEQVRILVPCNMGEEECLYIAKIASGYFDYSDVTIAILDEDRNRAFQHSIIIAGEVAAITSFGFHGSQNILSLGHENHSVINALIVDYDNLFNCSSIVLRNRSDYTPLEEANKFAEMLEHNCNIYYYTYAIPPGLIPVSTMKQLIFRVDGVGLNAEKHCDIFCHNLTRFLKSKFLYTTFIRHSLNDVMNGLVKFPLSRKESLKDNVFAIQDYLDILRYTLALYNENTNLVIKLLEPDEAKHNLLAQETNYLSISRQTPKKYTYISTNPTVVAYAAKLLRDYFADASKSEARQEVYSVLHRTITSFEEHLNAL